MPPSGFSRRSVRGAIEMMWGCYEEVLEEVHSGKHETVEAAFEHEIKLIEKALNDVHITDKGELTERPK